MTPNTETSELKNLILENQQLLAENNELLKKMHRSSVRHFWFNIAWIVIFLGLPLIAFYKLAMPMYQSFSASPTSLSDQLKDVQELKSFLDTQR
jgi:hypothetical protein